ncbi:MAG: tRNA (adenosine(37)-N6)-dimethylallyltransferase MiaA [Clostridia bacterium]
MENGKKPLVVIVGPTAVGKTEVAISLAKRLDGMIVSADSMQIYRHMNIGSAKPTKEDMDGIPHFMIDEVDPNEDYSVACYQKRALEYISLIHNKNRIPILAGGTGLYVNSVVYPMDFTQARGDWEYRRSLMRLAEREGKHRLYKILAEKDPVSAKRIHPNDQKRIIRALEVFHLTGRPMSEFSTSYREKEVPFRLAMCGLTMDRKTLYNRINLRVDRMVAAGLVNEVKNLVQMGYSPVLPSMQGLGYKEITAYLNGQISLEDAIARIKRDTRRYAKRQFTWFKRDKRIRWFNVLQYKDPSQLIEEMMAYIQVSCIINCPHLSKK